MRAAGRSAARLEAVVGRVGFAMLIGMAVTWLLGGMATTPAAGYPSAGYPRPSATSTALVAGSRAVFLPLLTRDVVPTPGSAGGYPAPGSGGTPTASPAASGTPSAERTRTPAAITGTPTTPRPERTGSPTVSRTPTVSLTRTAVATATRTATPGAAEAARGLAVTSQSDRRAEDGAYLVLLRVENRGSTTAYNPRVGIAFRGPSGAFVSTASESLVRAMLPPGAASTVMVIAHPPVDPTGYEVYLYANASSDVRYVQDRLAVADVSTRREESSVFVTGELRNTTGDTIDYPILDVALYSAEGRIADHDAVYPTSGASLGPNQAIRFSARFYDGDGHVPGGYKVEVLPEGRLRSAP
jgi:hypothetical protein